MWATVVNRDGVVCAVAFTGNNRGDQWPGSRVISAQKANTANAFSLPRLALSTANLYSAVQPGGSLFGLQESNPVDVGVAYGGNSGNYGQANDPMVNGKIGGVNVFGGGLGLYSASGQLVGAVGVSGDTSCADHNIAWRTRHTLNLDHVPAGVAAIFAGDPTHKDTHRVRHHRSWSRCRASARADGAIPIASPGPAAGRPPSQQPPADTVSTGRFVLPRGDSRTVGSASITWIRRSTRTHGGAALQAGEPRVDAGDVPVAVEIGRHETRVSHSRSVAPSRCAYPAPSAARRSPR